MKRWINTRVEYEWDNKLNQLIEISKEGYWYEGPMTLCTWLQTALVTGTTLYGVWSSQKGGKERAELVQRRGAMLTEMANKRIKQRNKEMLQTSRNIYDKGGEAVISAYLSSTKQIQDTKAEASGSGAVLSGTIDDVMRAQKSQSNSMQEAIVQNTNKNIESLTRQTKDQNEADLLAASQGQEMANAEAHSIHQANQRQFLAGIMNAAVSGYSAHSNRTAQGTGRYQDKAFWTKDWASWEQIKAGEFTIG